MILFLMLGCFALWFYIIMKKRRNLPPGPLGLPVIGHLLYLNASEPYVSLTEWATIYGGIYGIYLGSVYTVVLSSEHLIREALKSEVFTGRAPLYITHGIMGGYGLICSEGELWKDQRKLSIGWLKQMGMTKFSSNRSNLESRIEYGVTDCIKMLSEEITKGDINPFEALHHTIGNVMNEIVFGLHYEQHDTEWKYLQNLQEEGVKHIGVSGVVNFLPWLRFLPSNKRIIEFLLNGKEKTHNIYDRIIAKVQTQIDTNEINETSSIVELFLRERKQRLINSNPKAELCSDEQLRHLLADLFGAGVDTTLTTLRWFLLFVSHDPEIQSKIKKEMRLNLAGEQPTLSDSDKLPYLRACIAESQRIRSVVPIGIPHGTTDNTEFAGFSIPKGTMIIPLQWAVHMDPNFWPDPDTFDPERFIDRDGSFFCPPNFIPFQTGKRMCLGDELARMILFGYCSRILFQFDIVGNLAKLPYGNCGITLTPPPYWLSFRDSKF